MLFITNRKLILALILQIFDFWRHVRICCFVLNLMFEVKGYGESTKEKQQMD